jgi:hypothetical protein
VCGGCCFRVDVMPLDEADKADSAEAAGSGDVDAVAAGRVQLSVLLVRSKKRDEFIWPKGGWEKVRMHSSRIAVASAEAADERQRHRNDAAPRRVN